MKISKSRLKQIIKEELEAALLEQNFPDMDDAFGEMDRQIAKSEEEDRRRAAARAAARYDDPDPRRRKLPARAPTATFAVTDKASALKFLPLYLKVSPDKVKGRRGLELRSKLLADHDVYQINTLKDKMEKVIGYKFNGHVALIKDL